MLIGPAVRSGYDELGISSELQDPYLEKLLDMMIVQAHGHHKLDIPKKAPAKWRHDRQGQQSAPDFIKQHYGKWLRQDATGLSRRDIRRLDPDLYVSLTNWLTTHRVLPADCPLPTINEVVSRELSDLPRLSDDDKALSVSIWRRRGREARAARIEDENGPKR